MGDQLGARTFDGFYRDEYCRLVPVVAALVGDRAGAEDVVQEALAEAQRHWATVGAYDKPGAWVRRVALNRAANVRRRSGRERGALGRLRIVRAEPIVHELPDEPLWTLVRELPDQQRRAVVLHYVGDLSVADVADVMECSEGTVKTHLSRARAALAQRYPTDAGGRDHA
ncbi:MAG: RNA polymerase sigma factor [Ilumatobacteraceae bacterium]